MIVRNAQIILFFSYIMHEDMEKQFYDIAKNNWNNGQQLETMGYLIGFESNDTLIATEIIIPTQTGSSDMVIDNGKSIIKLLLTSMLRMPRQNSTLKTSERYCMFFNNFISKIFQ